MRACKLLIICTLTLLTVGCSQRHSLPPNIVLIMTDDQGYGDLRMMENPLIETPNIDAMATRSATLQRFYVSPVCAPTRASLMTGRYNYRTRAIDTWIGRAMMDTREVTVAEILREAGYATGIFGKWHLGDCYPMRPQDQGFEEVLVHRGGGLAQPSEPFENNRRYTNPILFRNGEQVQTEGFCTDVYFREAIAFMEKSQAAGKPFFAYIPTNAPHDPFEDVPQELYEKYSQRDFSSLFRKAVADTAKENDKIARIFSMVENADQNVGKLFENLDRLGLTQHTLVIFMTDNGANTMRYVGNIRGMKSNVHEGGIRSFFIAHWPERFRPGTTSDRIAAHIDLLPTFLEVAGVSLPDSVNIDGRSLIPLLTGNVGEWPDRNLFIQSHRGDSAIRYHNFAAISQQYKLVHPSGFGSEQMPENVPFELYDLKSDPGEAHNLAESMPDKAAQLRSVYDQWFSDVSSTRPDNYAKPAIIIGSDKEPVTVLTKQDWQKTGGNGWGSEGFWRLLPSREGMYHVEVRLSQPRPGTKVEIRIGEQQWAKITGENEVMVSFDPVSLAKEETRLAASLENEKGLPENFHIFVNATDR
ncbi:MAG: arylsulfatase [Bacteroidia bacterium]